MITIQWLIVFQVMNDMFEKSQCTFEEHDLAGKLDWLIRNHDNTTIA